MTKKVAEKKALQYLKKQFIDDEEIIKKHLDLRITKETKQYDKSLYDKNLSAFRFLFNLNDEEIRTALWNNFAGLCSMEDICFKDFSKEEQLFLKEVIREGNGWVEKMYENINNPITTKRLILRPFKTSDLRIFCKQMKVGDESLVFYGYKYKKSQIKNTLNNSLCFIVEEKDTQKVVGFILLNNKKNILEITYYIFAEYRQLGYCQEAIKAVCDEAFNNKLVIPFLTERWGIFVAGNVSAQLIRAKIRENNIPAIKTIESCGFEFEALLHKNMYVEDVGNFDELDYYITKEMWNNK